MDYISSINDKYVTYLRKAAGPFDINAIFTDLTPRVINKPKSAFWGSPLNAKFGWKDWCESEEWGDLGGDKVIWTLQEGSKILRIIRKEVEDMKTSPLLKYYIKERIVSSTRAEYGDFYLNFTELARQNYAAVELMDASIGHSFTNRLELSFNVWDCQSIVVLDPSKLIILSIEEGNHIISES